MYDIAILGAGPGGYTAAIRAARIGLKVCLIEREKVGGTCLNMGCIPTKYLLTASKKYSDMIDSEVFGIEVQDCTVNMGKMLAGKESVVNRLVKGVQFLIKKNGIDFKTGVAVITGKNEVTITANGNIESIAARNIIIATGTSPAMPNIFGYDRQLVCSSNEALNWKEIPEKLIIVGGGVIGCEFATIYANLGSSVTLIELLPNILSAFDTELAGITASCLRKNGVEIITGAKLEAVEKTGNTVNTGNALNALNAGNAGNAGNAVNAVNTGNAGNTGNTVNAVNAIFQDGRIIGGDKLLVSIGRSPNTVGIGLEALGVITDSKTKKIMVDEYMKTNIDNIYAIGDVCNSPLDLAHTAMKEGLNVAENISGKNEPMEYHCIPNCVFTYPEIATVGLAQEKAGYEGRDVRIGRFSFAANGKALSIGEAEGFVKIIIDRQTDIILGAQIAGPHATDLIAELAVMIQNRCTGKQLADTVHAHPTLAEAIWESVESAYGKAIHM